MKKWKTKGQAAVKVNKAKGKYTQIVLSNLFILFDLIWVDVTQLVTTSYWLRFQPLLHLNEMICGSVKDSWNWVFFIPASGRHILHYYSYLFIGVVLLILFDVDILHFDMLLKRQNTLFSMDVLSFRCCHAIATSFWLNEKIGIACCWSAFETRGLR